MYFFFDYPRYNQLSFISGKERQKLSLWNHLAPKLQAIHPAFWLASWWDHGRWHRIPIERLRFQLSGSQVLLVQCLVPGRPLSDESGNKNNEVRLLVGHHIGFVVLYNISKSWVNKLDYILSNYGRQVVTYYSWVHFFRDLCNNSQWN